MELHVELVLVHVTIQNQLIRKRAFESEVSMPIVAAGVEIGAVSVTVLSRTSIT
jgi:hypothetical protein